ncbi:MAG: PEGA domain-containing protein, partial [Gammaproteobacteria bacterium]|nr:PEGA domain-containing protein [Gammaproteobacteria bacterium]
IDGSKIGNTPTNIADLKPGKYLVEVKVDGHENWSESVEVTANKENHITAILKQLTGSVNIKSEPTNAIITIDGSKIGNTPTNIADLKPGKYLIEAKVDGHENWNESVEVTANKENHITAILKQLTSPVNIKSEPTNATIIIDGNVVGSTPANIDDIKPGKHLVEIKMDGHDTWSKKVNIVHGKAIELTATLQIKAGIVNIASEPPGAAIFIDGKIVGKTPVIVTDPSPGTHTIELKLDGFETWSEKVEIMPGKEVALAAVLQSKAGSISIKSNPSNAMAFIEGEEIGKTPITITNSSPGTYYLEVRMDGYESWNKNVDFELGKEITITADLQMKAGSISINSNPSGAIIHIDGKKSGKTPETITDLSPGIHSVRIIMDGYEDWSESVDIKGDKENTLSANLLEITGSININSNPPEATLYLDGEKIGITPDTLKSVAVGTHEVEVKMDGFAEWKKIVTVKKGKEFTLNATLQLNTGSVNIETDPAEAIALLNGKDVGKTPVNLTGIKIGIYEVELQKEGYSSCKKTIKIKAGKEYPLTAKLMEMTGTININSTPSNAIIRINGKKSGNTPAIIANLVAGEYQLEVMMSGYEVWSDIVNINPGKESTVTAELQKESGSVNIDSNPSNAIIFVDNKEVGTTPKIITDLSHEKHLIEVRMDGHEDWGESINMEQGVELSVMAELQMIAGSVSISSEPSNAKIIIDSKKAGSTPKTLTGILPGEHQVEIRME